MEPNLNRKCTRCNRTKSLTLFSKHKNQKDGYNLWCKSCIAKKVKKIKENLKENDYLKYKAQQFRSNWIRRAKNNGVDPAQVPSSAEIYSWLQTKYPMCCEYTGENLDRDFGVDHKVSIFRGGTFDLNNLAITSLKINGAKGDLTEEEFKGLLKLINTWEDKGQRILRRLNWSNSMFQRSK